MRIDHIGIYVAAKNEDGAYSMRLTSDGDSIHATSYGPGASLAAASVPELAGFTDNEVFIARDGFVRELHRRNPGLRFGRTYRVIDALIPSILEQKVTGLEAKRSYRALVLRFGAPAPGPLQLMLPPDAHTIAALGYYEFHPLNVERRRADTIRRACLEALPLENAARGPATDSYRRLRAIPGIGDWTCAEVGRIAFGDTDAVSVGDYHLKHLVSFAFTGERQGTDERMLELLEPYRGQRARVCRLIEVGHPRPPRRGPRMAPGALQRI